MALVNFRMVWYMLIGNKKKAEDIIHEHMNW